MSFPRSRLPVWLHTLLVAALLWGPLWGHWHGIEHGSGRTLSAQAKGIEKHVHAERAQNEQAHKGHSPSLGHEADTDLCRVLDHLSQAERLGASCSDDPAPIGVTEQPTFRAAVSSDQDLWSSAQARAPPALI